MSARAGDVGGEPASIGESRPDVVVVPPTPGAARRPGRGYDLGLTRASAVVARGDGAAVLQLSEDGVGQLADAKLIAIDRVEANPDQPRRAFDDATIDELAASIRARGLLQPIRVRRRGDRFQVVAGERRPRAARLAGLREVPAIVVELDDDQAYVDALVENIQREALNPLDRAEALKRLRVALALLSWEAVGARIGVTRQTVDHLLNLTDLPPGIQEDLRSGGLTEKHGRALRLLHRDPALQGRAYAAIVEDGLSGEQAIALVRQMRREAAGVVDGDAAAAADRADQGDRAASTAIDGTIGAGSPAMAAADELNARLGDLGERFVESGVLDADEPRDLRTALRALERRLVALIGRLED